MKKIFALAIAVVLCFSLVACSATEKTNFEGTYKNTDTSYANGNSKIVISNINGTSSSFTGTAVVTNVYGINTIHNGTNMAFSGSSTSVTLTASNNNSLYWTGTFDQNTKTITPKSSPLTYSYKK